MADNKGVGLLVGHSFVRRLKADRTNTLHKDVMSPPLAAIFARTLQLDSKYSGIYTMSDQLNMVTDLMGRVDSIKELNPSRIVVDIASNNLAAWGKVDLGYSRELAEAVAETAIRLPGTVVVHAVLPRERNLACTPEAFWENASHYNATMRGLAAVPRYTNLHYNKMRGFCYKEGIDGRDVLKRPVSEWSADGIHIDYSNTAEKDKWIGRVRNSFLGAYK